MSDNPTRKESAIANLDRINAAYLETDDPLARETLRYLANYAQEVVDVIDDTPEGTPAHPL